MLPTIILPGYFAAAQDYQELESSLQQSGYPTTTVPLTKWHWVPTLGGRSVAPIIKRIHDTVEQMRDNYNSSQVNLIAHSAGGWIARIYLGEFPYNIHGSGDKVAGMWQAYPQVASLITLGTPHVSQERWTRKNLDFVANNYPGAFYPSVKYVCVAGKAIYGERKPGSWLAYNSYKLTIGEPNTWGDGITPIQAAHLEGATNLTLESVKHSPKSPGIWYGSPEIIPAWSNYLA